MELLLGAAGKTLRAADLTPDEQAFIERGSLIRCEVVDGRWVKRRVGPSTHKRAPYGCAKAPALAELRRKLATLEQG
jgi:hypothetical protein